MFINPNRYVLWLSMWGLGSALTNKYSEGQPGARLEAQQCQVTLTQRRTCKKFPAYERFRFVQSSFQMLQKWKWKEMRWWRDVVALKMLCVAPTTVWSDSPSLEPCYFVQQCSNATSSFGNVSLVPFGALPDYQKLVICPGFSSQLPHRLLRRKRGDWQGAHCGLVGNVPTRFPMQYSSKMTMTIHAVNHEQFWVPPRLVLYLQPSAFRRPSSLLPVCRLQKAFVSKMPLCKSTACKKAMLV